VGELPGPTADPAAPVAAGVRLTGAQAIALFDAQAGSRHLDLAARYLRACGRGFYTIGSAGHEADAAVGAALRPSDPALLHYRSGGFYLARAAQVPGSEPLRDVLLGLVGAADEPIAGGRHKVFGHHGLAVIPQTSTIASHLPRAVGIAFSIGRAGKLGVPSPWPADAITVASFGDASASHSTATGAINAACRTAYQGLPMPLLLVCEDNGLGISVRTPDGWVAAAYSGRPALRYFSADGSDPVACFDAACEAAAYVRSSRSPAFLHLTVVRFLGHAGSDAEVGYRTRAEIEASYARDPLLGTASVIVSAGLLTPGQVISRYEALRVEVRTIADEAVTHRGLASRAEVTGPLAPRSPDRVALRAAVAARPAARERAFGSRLPEDAGPLTLADAINHGLADALAAYPGLMVFGEDVGRKGGVYGVTRGLARRFGAGRVFDTLLDEQAILGLALGAGLSGLLPVPEIQYLAYLHNAEDQLRGEAASLQFFSAGQYRNPMVVRVAGLAYQKGFGGHFHNDNAVGVLRDIPGLVVAVPARASDAAAMLRTCLAAAYVDGTVCVFLEPIALYHTRDLYEAGDDAWRSPYADPQRWAAEHVPMGHGRGYGGGTDLTLVTFGNGVPMSLRVARRLAAAGAGVRVFDLRWLAPLPAEQLFREASLTGRVLVVDETRQSGGVSEGVIAALTDAGYRGTMARVTSADSYIPLGDAAAHVLLSEAEIELAARRLLEWPAALRDAELFEGQFHHIGTVVPAVVGGDEVVADHQRVVEHATDLDVVGFVGVGAEGAEQRAQVIHAPVVDAPQALGDRLLAPGPVADSQVDRHHAGGDEREQPQQPDARVAAVTLEPLEHLIGSRSLPGVEHRLEQRAPVGEVPVEAAPGDAEGLGERLDPYGVRAARGQGPQSLFDPFAAGRSGRRGHHISLSHPARH
jgi:2-oxoisovalerate dehydrogenase E1 component